METELLSAFDAGFQQAGVIHTAQATTRSSKRLLRLLLKIEEEQSRVLEQVCFVVGN